MSFFNERFLKRESIDWLGGCLSTACAIHCSLKPLLFLLPSVAWLDFLMAHSTEQVLLGTGVFLAITSTFWSFSKHRRSEIFLVLGAALVMIALGRYAFTGPSRTLLVVPGGLTIACTHLLNLRFCRNCGTRGNCGWSRLSRKKF